jgi:serine/threonine kinase PknH
MSAFISYSSRDRHLLEGLLMTFRRSREQTWLDDELSGGVAWWSAILQRIRACDVFITVLSKDSLESKVCRVELQYAAALGKPILTIQIGPLDRTRLNRFFSAMQIFDYENPTIDTSTALISAVHAARASSRPLPEPLPEEPPIPFAYLMRLGCEVSAPHLSAQEQSALTAELSSALEEDGDDATARQDIIQLLHMLRNRADVTYATRTEVDSVLAIDRPPLCQPP